MIRLKLLFFINLFLFVKAGYPPIGDEVQAGSVLLPASRRGRYLANIVRRQAVDGTGIKFNKDADRMNAEAKKKVDVLSEELLPYIIAEQERRTTLYKRIMTAIQNGEKGVTIAEIRNKPPLLIRKGLMFRCPLNRAPKEPDGSGIMMCEEDIEPAPVMYDSCLSAEDKELYVAENKYFFCNRHRVEGPDLPRNGTTVIGCAPIERTSLNYTCGKCALEDTDDVVVHYRYYPDRTYKYVTELDPDHEVCDHWNPCQIGYIFSLPSPDQATLANELWRDYKIIPPIPEDSIEEAIHPSLSSYKTSPRRLRIPDGYEFGRITRRDSTGHSTPQVRQDVVIEEPYVTISLELLDPSSSDMGTYYAIFTPKDEKESKDKEKEKEPEKGNEKEPGKDEAKEEGNDDKAGDADEATPAPEGGDTPEGGDEAKPEEEGRRRRRGKKRRRHFGILKEIAKKFLRIVDASIFIEPQTQELLPAQKCSPIVIPFTCIKCKLIQIMIRAFDFAVYNLDFLRFKMQDNDKKKTLVINMTNLRPQDFGNYFAVVQNEAGREERIQILTVHSPPRVLKAARMVTSAAAGEHFDRTITYQCDDCTVTDVLCDGESVLTAGRVSVLPGVKLISLNFPSFEDVNSCVYIGMFTSKEKTYRKVMAAIDTVTAGLATVNAPKTGEQFEYEAPISCSDCTIEKVTVNGVPVDPAPTRRSGSPPIAYYVANPNSIAIRITEYSSSYQGFYQVVFNVKGENCTKTILEIKDPAEAQDSGSEETTAAGGDATGATTEVGAAGETTAAGGDTPAPEGGDTPPEGEAPPEGEEAPAEEGRRKMSTVPSVPKTETSTKAA